MTYQAALEHASCGHPDKHEAFLWGEFDAGMIDKPEDVALLAHRYRSEWVMAGIKDEIAVDREGWLKRKRGGK